MKEINKTKLLIVIIASLVAIALIVTAVILLNKKDEDGNTMNIATESEFEKLKIKDINSSFSEESKETKLNFLIENLTADKVQKQSIDIQLIDDKGGVIVQQPININEIAPNGSYPVLMTLGGKIQGIKTIKLAQPENVKTEEVKKDEKK